MTAMIGLDRLGSMPAAPVMVVADESQIEPALDLVGSHYVVVSWAGEPELVNWKPAAGRKAICWPGPDREPMIAAANALTAVCSEVKVLDAGETTPESAVLDAWDWNRLVEWARPRATVLQAAREERQAAQVLTLVQPPPKDAAPLPEVDFSAPDYGAPVMADHPDDLSRLIEDLDPPPDPDSLAGYFDSGPSSEWPTPADPQLLDSLPPIKAEWLPVEIADFVLDQSAVKGVDPVQIALCSLVACAGAVTDSIKLQVKAGDTTWLESARLWGAVVGDPSTKKGPALAVVTERLWSIDAGLRKSAEQKLLEHEADLQVFNARMANYARMAAKGEQCERPVRPARPIMPRLLADDATVEGLRDVLADNPRGILVVKDELAGWFGAMDAYSGGAADKDRPAWLQTYNGGPRIIDRQGGRMIFAPNWSCSILGGIQPSIMQRIALRMGEDGMLQRFMVVISGAATLGEERSPDMGALERWGSIVTRLVAMRPADEPCKLAYGAQILRTKASRWIYERFATESVPGPMTGYIMKWEGLFPRLMLTYHLIAAAAAGLDKPEPIIGEDTARRVWAFMQEVLLPHATTFYRSVSGAARFLLPYQAICLLILARGWTEVKLSDLWHGWHGWRQLESDKHRNEVIAHLIESGWLRKAAHEKHYFVNPAVHKLYASYGDKERERRARKRGEIEAAKRRREA
jgi:hypothetical protein